MRYLSHLQRLTLSLLTCLLQIAVHAEAITEAITDGSLGPVVELTGEFTVDSNLGRQIGNNLFHSFQEFNINAGGSATFTGPDSVSHIITRVTGPHGSTIDGRLRVDIPNANFYLLNPNGIVFGKEAQLDMTGSFHASTANTLHFQDGQQLTTHLSSSPPLLSVAPPAAFGLLDPASAPAKIEIQGSFLHLEAGKTLALQGGDIEIQDGTLWVPNGQLDLFAQGRLSISQSSVETLRKEDIDNDGEQEEHEKLGNLDVSGAIQDGGRIFIQAGQIVLDRALLFADTYGDSSGEGIQIEVDNLYLKNGAHITADNFGTGQGGNVAINASNFIQMEMDDQTYLDKIIAEIAEMAEVDPEKPLTLFNKISTDNRAEATGQGGDILINTSTLDISLGLIETATAGTGDAGDITITTRQLNLNSGFISAGTDGQGDAGNIHIEATTETIFTYSSIAVTGNENASGNAGNIRLESPQISLSGSFINGLHYGTSDGGTLRIVADNLSLEPTPELFSGITTESQHAGGNIDLQISERLSLQGGSRMTAQSYGKGRQDHGGNLIIRSPKIFTLDDSQLLANAEGGNGGQIDIGFTQQFNVLGDSSIDVSSALGFRGKRVF